MQRPRTRSDLREADQCPVFTASLKLSKFSVRAEEAIYAILAQPKDPIHTFWISLYDLECGPVYMVEKWDAIRLDVHLDDSECVITHTRTDIIVCPLRGAKSFSAPRGAPVE